MGVYDAPDSAVLAVDAGPAQTRALETHSVFMEADRPTAESAAVSAVSAGAAGHPRGQQEGVRARRTLAKSSRGNGVWRDGDTEFW